MLLEEMVYIKWSSKRITGEQKGEKMQIFKDKTALVVTALVFVTTATTFAHPPISRYKSLQVLPEGGSR